MAQPIDVDEFFKEQKERMDISDEDWEEYEERMHHENRKRKRAQREGSKANATTNQHSDLTEENRNDSSRIVLESNTPVKKRKVLRKSAKSPSFADPIVRSPSPMPQNPTSSPPNQLHQEIKVTSNLRKAVAGPSTKLGKLKPSAPVHVHAAPTSPSSNVTTPSASPIKAAATTSALPAPTAGSSTSGTALSKAKARSAPRSKSLQDPPSRATSRKTSAGEKERAQAERLAKKAAQQAKREAEKAKKAQDDKEARMTPLEYAAILQEKWKTRVINTPPEKLFLTDKVVFLIFEEQNRSHKDTRAKLDIIAKNGGKVAAKYDPKVVTHIIPGGSSITLRKTLRALGLKSLSEISQEISTVNWDWIVSGLSKSKPDSEIKHETFMQRMAYNYLMRSGPDDQKGKGKGKQRARSTTNEHSVIEDFNSAYDSPPEEDSAIAASKASAGSSAHRHAPASTTLSVLPSNDKNDDPLLPFYAKARQEAEAGDSESEEGLPVPRANADSKAPKYKGFQCDNIGVHLEGASPNQDIIEKLAELREMHRDRGTQDDIWRVISYQKAIGSLKAHPTRIKSREEALKLHGVFDKTADKIMEIIRTGDLRRINYTKTEDLTAMRLFSGIYGVGSNTARKWYHQGLKSLDDVRGAVRDGSHKLSAAQEIGLEFYDDINDRMPRSEAQELFLKIRPIALSLDSRLSLEVMGSFRRGKATCGDIDILLTRPTDDGKTHAGILPRLCNLLHKRGILTEDLALPDEWDALEATYRGLCRKDGGSKRRRIDILCIPYESRGAARLYYTGDDIFNRSIRLKANKMDMSLNQRGLFEGVVRDPRDRRIKLSPGTLLCSDSEQKIFEILGVPWQEPHERVRGG